MWQTLRGRIRNEYIYKKLVVTPIEDRMRENDLRWFEHLIYQPIGAPIRKGEKNDGNIVNRIIRTREKPK